MTGWTQRTISLRTPVIGVLLVLGVMQVLLWCFLGAHAPVVAPASIALLAGVGWLARLGVWHGRVRLLDWGLATAIAMLIMLLGGEGRWFYATPDWQVRYAVLRDLTTQPWPFAYATGAGPIMLRAPLGLYLIPALVGKMAGFHAAEQALLAQDTLLLGTILALGGVLFENGRSSLLALGFFLGFSGMDVIGQWIVGRPLTLHLESWGMMQYSSHITQAFWVPQHAMAGWIFAVTYLLWREERVPVAVPLAVLWLMALFSPLALMGSVPFGVHALIMGWRRQQLSPATCAALALVVLTCLPSLLYLSAASGAVGIGEAHVPLRAYPSFILIEVGSFLLALWLVRRAPPFGGMVAALVAAVLLVVPFGQIGPSVDFTARASIPALAILAMIMARVLLDRQPGEGFAEARRWIMTAWLIGLATPAGEIWRAVTWPPAPEVMCGYVGVVPGGFSTYTAPLEHISGLVRPAQPVQVQEGQKRPCWTAAWRDPISGQWTLVHPY